MYPWADEINHGEPVVVEQSPTKVRVILWGVGMPAGALTLIAVLAPEDLGFRLVIGGFALILWWVFSATTRTAPDGFGRWR